MVAAMKKANMGKQMDGYKMNLEVNRKARCAIRRSRGYWWKASKIVGAKQ